MPGSNYSFDFHIGEDRDSTFVDTDNDIDQFGFSNRYPFPSDQYWDNIILEECRLDYCHLFKNGNSNVLFYPEKRNRWNQVEVHLNMVAFDNQGRVLNHVRNLFTFEFEKDFTKIVQANDHYLCFLSRGYRDRQVEIHCNLMLYDERMRLVSTKPIEAEIRFMSANSSLVACIDSGPDISLYDFTTDGLTLCRLIRNIKECGQSLGIQMSEKYLFVLFYYHNVKIFDLVRFELVGEINESIPRCLIPEEYLDEETGMLKTFTCKIKLVSKEYIALFDWLTRTVSLYRQDGRFGRVGAEIDLQESIGEDWTMAVDNTRHITFHDPLFTKMKFISLY